MPNTPRLIETSVPRNPRAVVLVLHGGASRQGSPMVSPTQLSVLRMVPIARRVARRARKDLAVFRLLNSTRGWDASHTPVDDVRWALDRIRRRWKQSLPVGLVGHSLGGRAALLAGQNPDVRSVVALNPWVYPTDDAALAGREVLIVHGSADRIASPARAAEVAKRIGATADVGFVLVEGGKHAMLRHHGTFDRLAAEFTAAALIGEKPRGVVADVRNGSRWLTV